MQDRKDIDNQGRNVINNKGTLIRNEISIIKECYSRNAMSRRNSNRNLNVNNQGTLTGTLTIRNVNRKRKTAMPLIIDN